MGHDILRQISIEVCVNQLDRYIFAQSLKPLVIMTACVTAIVWLTQILQKSEIMVEDGGSFVAFARVSILIIPNLLSVITPFTVFAATIYTLNRLKTDSELPVMSATGASTLRVARPLLLLALAGTVLTFYLNLDLMPKSYRQLKQTVYEVRTDIAHSLVQSGVFTTVSSGLMIYAEEVRPGNQYLGILIHDRRKADEPVTYMAESGLYRDTETGPRLHLARGTIQRETADVNGVNIVKFDETAVDLRPYQKPAELAYLEETERYISELLTPDMSKAYDREQAGVLVAEGHARLATPFYNLLFALIAMVALLKGGFNRFGYGRRILIAIAAVLFFRVTGFALQNAAAATASLNILQYLSPFLGIGACLGLLIGKPRLGLRHHKNSVHAMGGT